MCFAGVLQGCGRRDLSATIIKIIIVVLGRRRWHFLILGRRRWHFLVPGRWQWHSFVMARRRGSWRNRQSIKILL
jgi:hypothetical protein